jgi:cell division septum initiation protein DivIVA
MAKSKQPPLVAKETLDQLLDKVSNAREELVAIERTLERLRSEITALEKRKIGSRKTR